jgi:poly(3-hydroxybutyrate) depolymerase
VRLHTEPGSLLLFRSADGTCSKTARLSSFNALHCCGAAKARNLDDVGFVDSIVDDLQRAVDHAGGVRFLAHALFASGFSNGGFLTSHLSYASRHTWAAIAPTAGHVYRVRRTTPLPVAIHHCADDEKVSPRGCCMSESGDPTCCCDISFDSCVSTQTLFDKWTSVNRCVGGVRALPESHAPAGATCSVGVGCAAETMLCWHRCQHHAVWARSFDGAPHILSFFARLACHSSASSAPWCRHRQHQRHTRQLFSGREYASHF